MDYLLNMLLSGWNALVDYLTISRIISLLIAFFLSGAIAQFMSQGIVMKYFGPKSNKALAFLVAATSGVVLAVCSCSVLPMFASIRKKGAGIGPAVTFLFAGPAINVLAITFTFNLLGFDIGFVRVFGAIILSIVIGMLMYLFYNKSEQVKGNESIFNFDDSNDRQTWKTLMFFVTLISILISGIKHWQITLGLVALLIPQLILFFYKSELWDWCKETFGLAKKIIPLFIVGVFLAGVMEFVVPSEFIVKYLGENTIVANLISAVFGAFLYFATLTEVPIVTSFMNLGMTKSAAISLLLAGPSLSLPNMIVIGKVMGVKKTATYIAITIVLSAIIGIVSGYLIFN